MITLAGEGARRRIILVAIGIRTYAAIQVLRSITLAAVVATRRCIPSWASEIFHITACWGRFARRPQRLVGGRWATENQETENEKKPASCGKETGHEEENARHGKFLIESEKTPRLGPRTTLEPNNEIRPLDHRSAKAATRPAIRSGVRSLPGASEYKTTPIANSPENPRLLVCK
jgi:hypothetical protein